jgi:hypothetical protein
MVPSESLGTCVTSAMVVRVTLHVPTRKWSQAHQMWFPERTTETLNVAIITSRQIYIEATHFVVFMCRLHPLLARNMLLRPHALSSVAVHVLGV